MVAETSVIHMLTIFFIFAAQYLFLLPIFIFGIYFLMQSRYTQKKILILAIPSVILTYLTALLAGHLYYDPRPFVVGDFTPLIPHAPDNGFPSDHALLVSVIAIIGSYCNLRLGIVLWALGLVVAVARVYVGLHHPIDILGSIAIAVIVTSVIYIFIKHFWQEEIA